MENYQLTITEISNDNEISEGSAHTILKDNMKSIHKTEWSKNL